MCSVLWLDLLSRYPLGSLLGEARKKLPFANAGMLKSITDAAILALLGPRNEADEAAAEARSKSKKPKAAKPAKDSSTGKPEKKGSEDSATEPTREWKFPAPDKNLCSTFDDGLSGNTEKILKDHLSRTGGRVRCRFPPEPNGYLHIGHAKAMYLDFGYAKKQNGITLLRFDDTNPEAESQEFIDGIVSSVKWLGHTPVKVTYSSDYFHELFALGQELIKRGKAYACHQTKDQIEASREKKEPSPWRDRPVAESLRIFELMRQGRIGEGEATIRMKQDIQSSNPTMWDLVAFRVKFVPHPHAGDEWCVYPSYDFTHCVVDSLEDITHSLCTLEFNSRHESYMWLLDSLDLYKPFVWEFSKLMLTYTILSKRRLTWLVESGVVRGWDDPRLLTLDGLRRRGYSPSVINRLCEEVGVTRRGDIVHSMGLLEELCRREMDHLCPRAFCVLEPVRVILTNMEDKTMFFDVPVHPKRSEMGTRRVPLSRVVYVERKDVRGEDEKGFFGIAPGKTVWLRYGCQITCESVSVSSSGEIEEVKAVFHQEAVCKTKGVLHWVSSEVGRDCLHAEIRLYERLTLAEDPMTKDWKEHLNPDSLVVVPNAVVEPSLANVKNEESFQFERVGFFTCDRYDSKPDHLVFNRTVSLKDSYNMSV